MKTYNIYNLENDEILGTVEASDVIRAEIIASEKFDIESNMLCAISA